MKVQVNKVVQFSGHGAAIYALEKSNVTGGFYTGSGDGQVVEWNPQESADGRLLIQVPQPVYCLKLLSTTQLQIGTGNGNLHLIDLQTKQETKNIQVGTKSVFDIKIHAHKVYVSCGDGVVSVFEKDSLSFIHAERISEESCRILAIQNDQMAIGSSDNHIYLYHVGGEKPVFLYKLEGHTNSVFSLAFHPEGKYLLSGSRDATMRVWDLEVRKCTQVINAHLLHLHQIVFSPAGNLFSTCSMDKSIKIWDAKFELLKVLEKPKLKAHNSSVNKLLWLDNETLVSISDDRTVISWQFNLLP
ncbi:MAG: WD40 repeat domain-containing protein [Flavobacteriaceae bacterium]|nr:WD40 repeat domain-containing protein [Flavobacteriaceae bacterium]